MQRQATDNISYGKTGFLRTLKRNILRDRYLLLLVLPAVLYYIIFHYIPMYGLVISFTDFNISKGILGSDWVGLKWFTQFFSSVFFVRVIKNTLLLSLYSILWGFPVPIIFSLLLNEVKNTSFKRTIQTLSYLPYFISVVIVVGMLSNFLSPNFGIVNSILKQVGIEPVNFMMENDWFRTLYIVTGIWQTFGYSSIIYLAALTSIDPTLYDASDIDGASRWQRVIFINIPAIAPTIIIMLVLALGNLMSVGFEKVLLMQNPVTYEVSDVISTYVYRSGVLEGRLGFSTAVGFFNSAVNFTLLVLVNYASKKTTESSLW